MQMEQTASQPVWLGELITTWNVQVVEIKLQLSRIYSVQDLCYSEIINSSGMCMFPYSSVLFQSVAFYQKKQFVCHDIWNTVLVIRAKDSRWQITIPVNDEMKNGTDCLILAEQLFFRADKTKLSKIISLHGEARSGIF